VEKRPGSIEGARAFQPRKGVVMTRFLLALPLLATAIAAAGITDLIPYLETNTTSHFKSLITTPDDANAKRPDNNKTILMYAVWVGNAEAVTHLLDRGADVNAKDSGGATALLLAVFRNRTEIALELIRRGADINTTADDGMTPLMMSRVRQNRTIKDAILQQAASHTKE
jgi:ankyrin repeat protein